MTEIYFLTVLEAYRGAMFPLKVPRNPPLPLPAVGVAIVTREQGSRLCF